MTTILTSKTKQEFKITEKQDPLVHLLEKQAKEYYQGYMKQNEQKLHPEHERRDASEVTCCECKEKTKLINSLKARIEELEAGSVTKNNEIKKLTTDVQLLFDMVNKKDVTEVEEKAHVAPTHITITTTTEIDSNVEIIDSTHQSIEKNRLSVDSIQFNEHYNYNYNYKDSYSDSALYTDDDDDDDDTSGSEESVKLNPDWIDRKNLINKNDKPSEWLDVAPTLIQERIHRAKANKKNLDRWNYKMASNGLLPIALVGKVDAEKEEKIQTHRKRHSTSAIWLKNYETKQNSSKQQDERFKIPSFNFKPKQTEVKESSISLKSSVSTSIFETPTTSHEMSKENPNFNVNSKAQQILALYK